jgi:hypothetical protein
MTTQQLFAQGTEAFVRYQAELKDGTTFQNTEYIQVELACDFACGLELHAGHAVTW